MPETTHDALVRQIGTAEELLAYFQGFRDGLDGEVAAKLAEVDAFLAATEDRLLLPRLLTFDPTVVHSKTSMAPTADAADDSQSEWQLVAPLVGTAQISASEAMRAVVFLQRAYSQAPGYPAYDPDYSRTLVQFVLATAGLTNAQIDARLAERAVAPALLTSATGQTVTSEIPIVRPDGASGTTNLYVRFKNITADGSANPPQEITTYGGNTVFQIDRVHVHV